MMLQGSKLRLTDVNIIQSLSRSVGASNADIRQKILRSALAPRAYYSHSIMPPSRCDIGLTTCEYDNACAHNYLLRVSNLSKVRDILTLLTLLDHRLLYSSDYSTFKLQASNAIVL